MNLLQMDYTTTLSECEIRLLLIRERYYRDSGQWDKLRDVYHPDNSKTRIDISWYVGHVDNFIQGSMKQASKGLIVIRSINPSEIIIRGQKPLPHPSLALMPDFNMKVLNTTLLREFGWYQGLKKSLFQMGVLAGSF
ncbi:hypothetical protein F5884DRAFT_904931 [Xylogone sp. PMI_703]|nr:hypothetical protein F5884DRAFT_904931 [Xylogone sp. PMI_703]